MEILLYPIIVFLATALGATSGAGGGAIIKPVFDLIGIDNVTVIGIYSTIAVFSMCLSSIYKHSRSGMVFEKKILYGLSMGSVLGGLLGDSIFKQLTQEIPNHSVTLIQSILLFIVLLAVLLFTRFSHSLPPFQLQSLPIIFLLGLNVGALSVFLGIGGGPLNVIILVGLMGFTTKDSAPYSIAMIFFAQIPKIISLLLVDQAENFRWQLVPFLVISAILGGTVGTQLNRKLSNKQVNSIYSLMMAGLLLICVYNILSNIA